MGKLGYVIISLGTAVTFGGILRTFMVLGSSQHVLLWGVAAIVGIVLIGYGAQVVWTGSTSQGAADPEKAVSKTDSRFGRR